MCYMTIARDAGGACHPSSGREQDIPLGINPGEVGAGLLRMGPNLHGGRF